MSENNLKSIYCNTCGIHFGFNGHIENAWRQSRQTFYCPNGHGLAFSGPSERDKELDLLHNQLKKLKDELAIAQTEAETQKKRLDKLAIELGEPKN